MAPFGSSSDSNTIERGGLLTVLHIFFKKISDTLQIRTAEGNAAPETGEEGGGREERRGTAGPAATDWDRSGACRRGHGSRGPAAEGAAARKTVQRGGRDAGTAGAKDNPAQQTVQRGGTARRAGRGKRQPGAADCATRRAERDGGRMLIVLRARRVAR
jgi:hypothetical protein